jgi:hypothetical protein
MSFSAACKAPCHSAMCGVPDTKHEFFRCL